MKATITTTSRTLEQILSAEDYGILRGKYTTVGGGIFHNSGSNDVYIETGKPATPTDSYTLGAGRRIGVGFMGDIFQTQFKTSAGSSDLIILF